MECTEPWPALEAHKVFCGENAYPATPSRPSLARSGRGCATTFPEVPLKQQPHTRHTTLSHTPLLPFHPHATSPFSVLAFSRRDSFFCLRADALNLSFICRRPPRYSHVHTNTTAKLKKMYAHIMPVPMLACISIRKTQLSLTKVSPNIPWENIK